MPLPDSGASPDAKRALVVAISASFIVNLDSSIVTVALPQMSRDTGGGLLTQQWVVAAYLLALSSLVLIAGVASDLAGSSRVLTWGVVVFVAASVACATAPNAPFLIASRAVQGAGGALITASALAVVLSTYRGVGRSQAVGSWTAWSSSAVLLGPTLGGVIVDSVGWRWVFILPAIPGALTLLLVRGLPRDAQRVRPEQVDGMGAVLSLIAIGGGVLALIEQGRYGWSSPPVVIAAAVGAAAGISFVSWERRAAAPLVPSSLFRQRTFVVGNTATIGIYGAVGLVSFVIPLAAQEVWKAPAWQAGLITLPPTVLVLVFSTTFARWAARLGPRRFIAGGGVVAAIGSLALFPVAGTGHWTSLLPGLVVLGLGRSMYTAPLTAAVLLSVPAGKAGVGSALNNVVARLAFLSTVASVGVLVGNEVSLDGFRRVVIAIAALFLIGGGIAWFGLAPFSRVGDSGRRQRARN